MRPLVFTVEFDQDTYDDEAVAALSVNGEIIAESWHESYIGDIEDAEEWAISKLRGLFK